MGQSGEAQNKLKKSKFVHGLMLLLCVMALLLAGGSMNRGKEAQAQEETVTADQLYISASCLSAQEEYLPNTGAPGKGKTFRNLVRDAVQITQAQEIQVNGNRGGAFSVYNFNHDDFSQVTPSDMEFTVSYQYYGKYEGTSGDEFLPIADSVVSSDGKTKGAWNSANEGILYTIEGDSERTPFTWKSEEAAPQIYFPEAESFSGLNPANLEQLYVLITVETTKPFVQKLQGMLALPAVES